MEKIYIERSGMDRRQQNIPVQYDRRCDIDRRVNPDAWLEAQKQKAIIQRSDADRRQVSIPVQVDRRCGIDRRLNLQEWQDYQKYKELQDKEIQLEKNLADGALSIIPFGRRLEGIKDALNNHETFKGIGKIFLQLINVHEDGRDIKGAVNQIKTGTFIKHEYQNPFSFVRGTPLESKALMKYDKTLFDIEFVKNGLKKIGLEDYDYINTERKTLTGRSIKAYKMEGKLAAKILGRASLRIPVLSILFLGLLELPAILSAKDHTKQAIKSGVNVATMLSMGAVLGAIGAFAGPVGSLVGLGIGSYLGTKLAKKINSLQGA